MEQGRIVSNPDENHFCEGNSEAAIVMDQLLKEKREEITRSGKRPRTAYREVLSDVAQRLDPEEAQEVERHLGAFKRRRSGFYKAYNRKFPAISTLQELENCDELQVTAGGEQWILALNVEENVLLLATDADLQLLHQSDCWVADGNFDYQPPAFSQLYTIHGFYNGECKAAISVLMPDRRLETYSLVLRTIRQALIDRHHSIGDIEGKVTSKHSNLFQFQSFSNF